MSKYFNNIFDKNLQVEELQQQKYKYQESFIQSVPKMSVFLRKICFAGSFCEQEWPKMG